MAVNPGVLPSAENKTQFVRTMFDRIAPRYDLLNRVMTLGLDQRWRRALAQELALGPGARVLDLATGTGDLAQICHEIGARPVGVDLARNMLRHARRRAPELPFLQADGCSLPLPDRSMHAITCGFAVRNFSDLDAVFRECARVLRPGGQLAILEVDQPRNPWLRRAHGVYFRRVVPRVGGWISDREAYRYLPESTSFLPGPTKLNRLLTDAGFDAIQKRTRLFGAIQWIHARRRS